MRAPALVIAAVLASASPACGHMKNGQFTNRQVVGVAVGVGVVVGMIALWSLTDCNRTENGCGSPPPPP